MLVDHLGILICQPWVFPFLCLFVHPLLSFCDGVFTSLISPPPLVTRSVYSIFSLFLSLIEGLGRLSSRQQKQLAISIKEGLKMENLVPIKLLPRWGIRLGARSAGPAPRAEMVGHPTAKKPRRHHLNQMFKVKFAVRSHVPRKKKGTLSLWDSSPKHRSPV